jgi:hypothetical protein
VNSKTRLARGGFIIGTQKKRGKYAIEQIYVLDYANDVLKETPKPLTYQEIWSQGQEKG